MTEEEGLSPFDFTMDVVEVEEKKEDNDIEKDFEDAREKLDSFNVTSDEAAKHFDSLAQLIRNANPRHIKALIALNKLFYFMPYIKGKGVKDIYLIKIARVGTKAEIHPKSNDKEPRLVFDLELIYQFPAYKPIQPNIFHAYRDTTLLAVEDK